jgi:hypothetical protein
MEKEAAAIVAKVLVAVASGEWPPAVHFLSSN